MRTLIALLAATALAASPAVAQHQGHHMPAPAPKPAAKPQAKKPAAKTAPVKKPAAKTPATKKATAKKATAKPAVKKPAVKKPAAKKPAVKASAVKKPPVAKHAPATQAPADPHAGHAMEAPASAPAADPHAGHGVGAPVATQDPHAGHGVGGAGAPAADPHAGHAMTAEMAEIPVGPPPAEALQGPPHAADTVWGAEMAPARSVLWAEHGGAVTAKLLIDRAEARLRKGRNGFALDGEGWIGGDLNKLWLKSEVEGDWGRSFEEAEVQALWSRAIGPFVDLQAGVRYDFKPRRRARLALGVQGLAPYWIEFDAAAFVSTKGDFTARVKAEHDVRITQSLILQPALELDFAAQDIREEGIGAGLSTAEAGLRLRYHLEPRFAPYVGVNLERAFGRTRGILRDEGEDPTSWSIVAGLHAWF